jgi:hypothetical protein
LGFFSYTFTYATTTQFKIEGISPPLYPRRLPHNPSQENLPIEVLGFRKKYPMCSALPCLARKTGSKSRSLLFLPHA